MTENKNYFAFSSSVRDLLFKDVTVSSKEGNVFNTNINIFALTIDAKESLKISLFCFQTRTFIFLVIVFIGFFPIF